MNNLKQDIVVETLFLKEDPLIIYNDVFSLTIAANLTKNCSSSLRLQCLQTSSLVFAIQLLACYYMMYDFLDFDNFQPIDLQKSMLRIIISLLVCVDFSIQLTKSINMLTFLKRQKMDLKDVNKRFINVALCSMQVSSYLIIYICFILELT